MLNLIKLKKYKYKNNKIYKNNYNLLILKAVNLI